MKSSCNYFVAFNLQNNAAKMLGNFARAYFKINYAKNNYVYRSKVQANFVFNSHIGDGVQQGPLGTSAIYWPIVPAPCDYDDREFGGMKIGKGNRSTRRKPAPSATLSTTNSTCQTRARTRAAAVGSQRLTA
jgi:hypothetical protein